MMGRSEQLIAGALVTLSGLGWTAGGATAFEARIEAISGKPALSLAQFDLEPLGYAVEEFFISGDAQSYSATATPVDGRWTVNPARIAPYRTRMVVVRPVDPQKFNGSVLVEWLNVSVGVDTPADWYMAHREILRSGYAYVAVSAQKVGVDGGAASLTSTTSPLTKIDPVRYGALNHPGDTFAFDIFKQAGAVVRTTGPVKPLGPLVPRRVLAIGESQSAVYLLSYVNALHLRDKAYDGYLIHSRLASAAPLDERPPGPVPDGVTIRSDLDVPVMTLITETDLVGGNLVPGRTIPGFVSARQQDTRLVRTWEIAGSSHADNYIRTVAHIDDGRAPIEKLAQAFAPTKTVRGTDLAAFINSGPQHHYVLQAALAHLNRWVAEGVLPPDAPALDLQSRDGVATLVPDSHGNAKGGIRTPWVDVPVARLSGLGQGLNGMTEPFDSATLDRLYPGGKEDYLTKFARSLDDAVKSGFILATDASEIRALAAASYPGK